MHAKAEPVGPRPYPRPLLGQRSATLLLSLATACFLLGQYTAIKYVGVLLPLLGVLVLVRVGGRGLAGRRLPVLVVLLTSWMVASYTWSADTAGTMRALLDVLSAVTAGVVVGLLMELEKARRVLSVVFKCVLVACVIALIVAPGWSTRPPAADPVTGWHALFGHKNGLGAFLALTVAVLLGDQGRRRYAWLAVVATLLVGSQSATGLGVSMVLVGMAIWQAGARQLWQPRIRSAYRLLSGMLVVVGAGFLTAAPSLLARALGRTTTLTGRTEIWGAVERQISVRPLIGHGWGGVWQESSTPTQEMWREARFRAYYAHNGYLDVLLQIGAVGGGLLLLLLLFTAVRLGRLRRESTAFWALLLLLALSAQALSESASFTGSLGLMLITLVATAVLQPGAARPLVTKHHVPSRTTRTTGADGRSPFVSSSASTEPGPSLDVGH